MDKKKLDYIFHIRFNSEYISYIEKVSMQNRLMASRMLREIIMRHLPEYDFDNKVYHW